MLLEGLHIPITTPFQADGSVALDKLERNVARYSKTLAAGLIVLGRSGEPTLLSDDETRDVLRTAAEAAAPEKVLLAGIARDSVRSVLALADFAAEQRYDAILIAAPTTLTGRSKQRYDELLTFFQTIADRSLLPIVLARTNVRSSLDDVFPIIAAHSNVAGCLNSLGATPSMHRFGTNRLIQQTASIRREVTVTSTFAAVTARMLAAESAPTPALVSAQSLTGSATAIAGPLALAPVLRTRTKCIGFQILSGNSGSLLDALDDGATGIAPAFATAAPQACYEIYAAWKDGDAALAEEKQARIREAAALAESLGPGGLKYACDLNGYAAGLPRLPLLPPTGEQRAALEALMHPLRN
ncbi:MAG TPA: dihydrodipicolinate synthase family protein [Acidobacteriaceae bacterium]|nr:dihydrodipicolinate synthase family protein [Acidobacteriaceae bacterium]